MDLEIVAIGNELLLGFTVDTNGAELGQALAAIGVRVARRTTVGDEPAAHSGRRRGGALAAPARCSPPVDSAPPATT